MMSLFRIFFGLACLILSACAPSDKEVYRPTFSKESPSGGQPLIFGVHPLHNPHRLFDVYQPLVDYLNRKLPHLQIRLEASRDYGEFEKKLANRHFNLALPNPYQTVMSRQYGYRIFAKMGDDEDFRGIVLVRKDSHITSPRDLKGRPVSYPAPTALAATLMPQWFLHEAGLDVRSDLVNLYVGSQESSIMNVFLGKTVAGATWPPPWRAFSKEHPEIAAQLEVKWQTPPLVNNGLIARDDLPPDTLMQIKELLIGLHQTEEGHAILNSMELSRFEAADDRTYQPVMEFLKRFEREVRPVKEQP